MTTKTTRGKGKAANYAVWVRDPQFMSPGTWLPNGAGLSFTKEVARKAATRLSASGCHAQVRLRDKVIATYVDGKLTTAGERGRIAPSKQGARKLGRQRAEVDDSQYSGKIAVRVRALREAKAMTVHQLADKAGVTHQAMYAYEQNTRTMPPDLYPVVAKALGCKSLADFFPPLK